MLDVAGRSREIDAIYMRVNGEVNLLYNAVLDPNSLSSADNKGSLLHIPSILHSGQHI